MSRILPVDSHGYYNYHVEMGAATNCRNCAQDINLCFITYVFEMATIA